jgi:hypothetical protein
MIIGLSGRMGSGKDTVGKIIQYLLSENVGDITLEDITSSEDHNWWLEEQSGFNTKKFAGKLKQIGSILSGVPVEKFEDQEFKKLNMGEEWNSPYNIPFSGPDFVEHDGAMTYREFLQRLGTEAMRDGLHTNVWVNALFADYKPLGKTFKDVSPVTGNVTFDTVGLFPNWIITDMRFPNELEAVVEKGGLTIRVNRKLKIGGEDYGYTYVDVKEAVKDGIMAPEHPSETALDDARFDYVIDNDGTLDELVQKVKGILIEEGII